VGRLIEQNLEISIIDFGTDFSSADEGQMGQFLMRQLMDSVLFVAEDAKNTVTLRKNKGAIQ